MAIQLATFPITVRKGDSSVHTFFLDHLDEDGNIVSPVDLTGWTILAQARTSVNAGGLVYEFPVTITPLSGIIEFYIDADTSSAFIPAGGSLTAEWEMQATVYNPVRGEDDVFTFAGGNWTVIPDLVDPAYPVVSTPIVAGTVFGSSDNTVRNIVVTGREPNKEAVIDDTRIQVTYQEQNESFDAENAEVGYVECLTIVTNITFDSLLDTPDTKTPNSFVTTNVDGTQIVYDSPDLIGGDGITITNSKLIDEPVVSVELQTNSGLILDSSGLAIDATQVVPTTRQVNAGNGLVQDNNTLDADMTIDVQTPLNSGLDAQVDQLVVDINNTADSGGVISGTDRLLLQRNDGSRVSVTRDDLLAGLGKGVELRGSILGASLPFSPTFDGLNQMSIPPWRFEVGDTLRFNVFGTELASTGGYNFIFDGSTDTPYERIYLRVQTSTNEWQHTPSAVTLFDHRTGTVITQGDIFELNRFYDLEITFLAQSNVNRFSAGVPVDSEWRGGFWNITSTGSSPRAYALLEETDLAPTTTVIVDSIGGQNGTLALGNWQTLPFVNTFGDVDNPTLGAFQSPVFTGLSPAGYSYTVILEDSQKADGIQLRLGGTPLAPITFTAFDQDLIQWIGESANGAWIHLATGNAVISVHGRQGVVTAQAGDYASNQVTVTPTGNLTSTDVQGALQEHQGDIELLGQAIIDGDAQSVHITGDEDIAGLKRFTNTDFVKMPSGNTSQRGIGENGAFRVNEETNFVEWFSNGLWRAAESVKKWQDYARKASDIEASRQQALNQFAASGFVHYGRSDTVAFGDIVNEGMYAPSRETSLLIRNTLRMGNGELTAAGLSKTAFPVTHIAGHISTLKYSDDTLTVYFPDAPNGAVIYDSSGNCRGSGNSIVDLADGVFTGNYDTPTTDKAEGAQRAFEGQILNGNFRLGTEYWNPPFMDGVVTNGQCQFTSGRTALLAIENDKDNLLEIGKEYIARYTIIECGGARATEWGEETTVGKVNLPEPKDTPLGVPQEFRFTAAASNGFIFRCNSVSSGLTMTLRDLSIVPVEEEVIINRHDVFGGEFFLEEVNLTNPFVYPFGMIQNQEPTIDGIPTTDSSRPDTYYSVFDGDTGSRGKGVDFFALDDLQKQSVLSNPDHNLYLLDDGSLVQWRMRQRTIAGIHNGDWGNVNPNSTGVLQLADTHYVQPQGINDTVINSVTTDITDTYIATRNVDNNTDDVKQYLGIFSASQNKYAVEGQCYFYVWGRVPRLNQGVAHPSFNASGAAQATDGYWYESTLLNSTLDCFTNATGGGLSEVSGRDDGRFYDVLNGSGQGGVNDDRLSAWHMGSKEESAKVFIKTLGAVYRGEEELQFTTSDGTITTTVNTGSSLSGDFTMTVVYGTPEDIQTVFPDGFEGIYGGVGIGSNTVLVRKAILNQATVTETLDLSLWTQRTENIDRFGNDIDVSPTGVSVVTFTTFANQTKESEIKPILNGYEGLGEIFISSHSDVDKGAILADSLINKILTYGTSSSIAWEYIVLTSRIINPETGEIYINPNIDELHRHIPTKLVRPQIGNTLAIKILWHQTSDDQQVGMNFCFNEMFYDTGGISGNEWGDGIAGTAYEPPYGIFHFIDNTSTRTDYNGNTVMYGTAQLTKPIGYIRNQARVSEQIAGIDL